MNVAKARLLARLVLVFLLVFPGSVGANRRRDSARRHGSELKSRVAAAKKKKPAEANGLYNGFVRVYLGGSLSVRVFRCSDLRTWPKIGPR